MLFEVENSGHGHFLDVKTKVIGMTPVEQPVDFVKVNEDQVWVRYPFRLKFKTNGSSTPITLEINHDVHVVDITGGAYNDMGSAKTNQNIKAAGATDYMLYSESALTEIRFMSGDITEVEMISTGQLLNISNFLKDMPLLTSFLWSDKGDTKLDDISGMLENTNLTTIPMFITSHVTNADRMLKGCVNVATLPLYDFQEVISMESAFEDCSSLTSLPIFNIGKCTNFKSTWKGCTLINNLPVFDVSFGENFESTFEDCTSITLFPNVIMIKALTVKRIFKNCTALISIDGNNVPECLNAEEMFMGCTAFVGTSRFSSFSGPKIENYIKAFYGCTSLMLINHPDYTGAKYTTDMFGNNLGVRLDDFSFPSLINGDRMFKNGGNSLMPDMSHLDMSFPEAESLVEMFATDITEVGHFTGNPKTFIAPKLKDMTSMFKGCTMDTMSSITIPNNCKIEGAWENCVNINLFPSFDVSNVESFKNTWSGCADMTRLRVEVAAKGRVFDNMLYGCAKLVCLPKIDTSNQTSTTQMFNGCVALTAPNLAEQTTIASGSVWTNSGTC